MAKKGGYGNVAGGLINPKDPFQTLMVVIAFLVLVKVLVVAIPQVFTGFVNLSNIPNMPFADLFQADGVMYLLIGGLVIVVIVNYFRGKNSR